MVVGFCGVVVTYVDVVASVVVLSTTDVVGCVKVGLVVEGCIVMGGVVVGFVVVGSVVVGSVVVENDSMECVM